MNNAYIINDIHFGVRNSNPIFLKEAKSVFETIKSLAKSDDFVIIAGDIFDNRNTISIKAMNVAFECFKMIDHLSVIIIPGNHDIHYVNRLQPNSLDPLLENFPNVKIYYEPKEIKFGINNILFVPWIVPKKTIDWSDIIKKSKANICIGHFDIQGFRFNSKTINDKHGFEKKMFNKFEHVYSGHYHHKQTDKNITYLGTQYQMTWDDYNVRKMLHVLDRDGNLKEVETGRDIFKKVNFEDDPMTGESYEGCYVKLICPPDAKPKEIKEYVEKLLTFGTYEVKVFQNFQNNYSVEAENIAQTLSESQDITEVISDVTKQMDLEEHIDKNTLFSLVDEIVAEAWETMGEV